MKNGKFQACRAFVLASILLAVPSARAQSGGYSVVERGRGLQDATLKFGKLTMTRGKAFGIKVDGTEQKSHINSAEVYNRWVLGSWYSIAKSTPFTNFLGPLH
jgi:ribosomal protein L13E